MNSSKPYLLRALYEWIVDNDCTPYVLVAIDRPGVQVPEGFGEKGQMVLNCSPSAVRYFNIDNEAIAFEARFSGVARQLYIPIAAVLAIYAQENGQGMFFEAEPTEENAGATLAPVKDDSPSREADSSEPPEPPEPPQGGGKPSLRIVK